MVEKKHSFTKTEIKAGVTVFAGLLVFCIFIAAINGIRPPQESNSFYTEFPYIAGLNAGADVRFGGVHAGRVDSVTSSEHDKSLIRVEWHVPKDTPVNEDCVAYVSQVSIASEKHLEVTTGSRSASFLESGSLVPKKTGGTGMFAALDDIADTVDRVLSDDGLLGDIRTVLGVREAEQNPDKEIVPITRLIANVNDTVSESVGLVQDLRGMVSEKQKSVDSILKKLNELADSGNRLLNETNDLIVDNKDGVKLTLDKAHKTAVKVEAFVTTLNKELAQVCERLQCVMGNVDSVVEKSCPNVEKLMVDLARMTANLKQFSRIIAERPEALIRGNALVGRE